MNAQLTDTPYDTAKDKQLILKAWVTFLKHGCQEDHFTDRLYKHISLHCSFIAHFNRAGFYNTYFISGDRRRMFLSQFDKRGRCESVEYGGTYWGGNGYEDIKAAMIEAAAEFIPTLLVEAAYAQRDADVATAKKLLAKHGISLEAK